MPAFEHASAPRAITTGKGKYREDSSMLLPTNIMKDPRVAKGSTYSAHHLKVKEEAAKIVESGGGEERRRRKVKKKETIYDFKLRESSRNELDLAPYLVEQVAPIAVSTVETQTAEFLPRPDSPEFVPMKTGIDVGTQLHDEVFDFDAEVDPLLQVIIGKTMEQALLEVESEAELSALEDECEKLGDEKKKEEERIQRMEAEAGKVWRAKKDKVKQEVEFARAQDEVRAKVAAVRYMREFLPVALQDIYKQKIDEKEWTLHTIGTNFLPWLYGCIQEQIEGKSRSEQALDDVIVLALDKSKLREQEAVEAERARLKDLEEAKEKIRRARVGKVKINITANTLGLEEDKVVGPLEITGSDTVRDLEDKIKEWLSEADVKFESVESGFLQLGYNGEVVGNDTVVLDIPGGELSVMGTAAGTDGNGNGEGESDGDGGGGGGGTEAS